MGGWPRGHRSSADIKEIGFPGPFFTPRREIAPRQQEWRPVPAARQSGPSHLIGLLPWTGRLPDPVRRGCPPARRVLAAGKVGRCGTRTPAPAAGQPGRAGVSVWPVIEPGPPGSQARGPGLPVTGRPRRSGEGQQAGHLSGRCAAAVLGVPRPRRQPSGDGGAGTQGADKLLRFRLSPRPVVPRPAIPVPAAGIPPGRVMLVNQRMKERGREPRPVYLACPAVYSRGPGRGTAGRRRT